MSLTQQDLTDIKTVVQDVVMEALDSTVNPWFDLLENQIGHLDGRLSSVETMLSKVEYRLEEVEGSVTALHNDVVELYGMAS